jgi:hypothetical protein
LDSFYRTAYLNGLAEVGEDVFPLPAWIDASISAAVAVGNEATSPEGLIESITSFGRRDGVTASIANRRRKAEAAAVAAIGLLSKKFKGLLPWQRIVTYATVTAAATTIPAAREAILTQLQSHLNDHPEEHQEWLGAIAEHITAARALGMAAGTLYAGTKLPMDTDFDHAYQKALASLAHSTDIAAAAALALAVQLGGLAGDAARLVIEATRKGEDAVAALKSWVASTQDGAGYYMGEQVATEVTKGIRQAMGDEYMQEVDYLTVDDDHVCTQCTSLEEGSPYPADAVPDCPAHAGCRCLIAPLSL